MTTSRIYAYRWPARLVSHKPFAAEKYFITSACIWQVFFCDFSEKIRFFFFIFFFLCPGTNFVQNAQSRRLFSVENPADSSRMPRLGGVYTKKPLSQRIRVASFLIQRCFGEEPLSLAFGSTAPLIGELSPKVTERFVTKERSSAEHSPAAASNEGKARLFKSRKATTRRPARPAKGSPI